MNDRFRVILLEEVDNFLSGLDVKTRDKIFYNILKSKRLNDKELFKKVQDEIWEFRTYYNKTYYRLFAFWDRTDSKDTIVVSTHGIIKKTDKIAQSDIDKAKNIRIKYFDKDENVHIRRNA
jgi:phage-related protein